MPTVIPVKFKYATRDLWFDPRETEALAGDHVICETERGLEIGLATEDPREVAYNEYKRTCGDAPLRPVVRLATEEDLDRAEELADQGEAAMPTFRRLAKEEDLDMKPVGVEYLFDGDKVVCYFSADERVDFRQLVRNLSRELHHRIDMRQIGVREEAALVGGFGHCGQELCCARFGRQFDPVSIRMAKEQDLPLNSTKISGACGRLMCCLRYEFEAYRDFKQRAPKRNAVIDTPLGKAKIVEYDTPKEELALRVENGKVFRVKLAEMETSEAAVKKSEELHCPCRPDTVTRDALERLNSPDVQMALAELDREAGLIPEETFDDSDIFVMPKPRRRPRRDSGEAEGDGAGVSAGSGSGSGSGEQGTRRRRRKGSAAGGEAAAKAEAAPQQGKRRARHAAPEATAEQTATPSTGTRRRRRHHSEQEGAASNAQGNSQAAASKQGEGQSTRRRRRPGDHGGTPAEGQAGQQKAAGRSGQQSQAPKHAQPDSAQPQDSAAPKRRRRRRHRGGGSGNSSGTADSGGIQ